MKRNITKERKNPEICRVLQQGNEEIKKKVERATLKLVLLESLPACY